MRFHRGQPIRLRRAVRMDLALLYCGQTILSSPCTRGFPGQHRRFAPPGVVGSTRFFAAMASLAFGRSASGVFVPERAPLWEFILTRDLSRVLTLRTFRLVGPPAPSQALTSPVAPNGHRRAFRTRRRAPCRDSVRAAWLPPRPEPLPRMPFKATSSRFRTPSIGSIPTSSAGNGHSDEQLAPNFQATWTPFLRSAATRPVTACGSPLFATPRRYLRHLSASSAFGKKAPLTNLCNQTELSNRAPCETASFRDGFRLAPVRPPFSGPALPPARYVRALEQHRRRRRRLAAFGGVAGPGWCRGLGVPRAPAAIIRLCFPAMGPPLLCQGRA